MNTYKICKWIDIRGLIDGWMDEQMDGFLPELSLEAQDQAWSLRFKPGWWDSSLDVQIQAWKLRFKPWSSDRLFSTIHPRSPQTLVLLVLLVFWRFYWFFFKFIGFTTSQSSQVFWNIGFIGFIGFICFLNVLLVFLQIHWFCLVKAIPSMKTYSFA